MVSWLGLIGGLIAVIFLCTNGDEDTYVDPTINPGEGIGLAAIVILQFALLQAVALGLDYLAAMKRALTGRVASQSPANQ